MIDNDDMSIILPARIKEFYIDTQTADIQISAERVFSDTEGKLKTTDRQTIYGVPVHVSSGGGWSLTFPIAEGDTCMICFSQIGYDHWLYKDLDSGGTIASQPTPHLRRQFSEDDGFAFVGFNTNPRAINSYSSNSAELRNVNSNQVISLKPDGSIDINSDSTVNITAPNINLVGAVVANDLTVGGVEVQGHVHTGDDGGTTGGMR